MPVDKNARRLRLAGVLVLGLLIPLMVGADQSCTGVLSEDPRCGPDSPRTLVACTDPARYERDLLFVEGLRPPGSQHWQAVQDLCADRLSELGFDVERHDYGTGVNVVGVLPGTSRPEERVLISAHYDHIEGCAGADDNATGVAGVLEAARVLSLASYERTLVAACWDEEERDLLGSRAYADREVAAGSQIVASYVLEMIGYKSDEEGSQTFPFGLDVLFPQQIREHRERGSRGDFIAVVSDAASREQASDLVVHGEQVGLLVTVLDLPEDLKLHEATAQLRRSDHASFWAHDIPAMMLTDTAAFRNDRYHCSFGPDESAVLDTTFASRVVAVTVGSAARALVLR